MAGLYQHLQINFMSGTGNSYRVAQWFAGEARERGHSVSLEPMSREGSTQNIQRGPGHLMALVMPTHGFTAPWAAIWFTLKLPWGRGTHAVVVATRGGTKFWSLHIPGLDGTTTPLIALLLFLKGYRVRGNEGIDMPSNWMAVHSALNASKVESIIRRAQVKSRAFINRVLEGKRSYGSFIYILLGIPLAPVSLGYVIVGRFWLGKMFFATGQCDGCGVCAFDCPHRAIRMWGRAGYLRPYWTYRCESCMRCMAYCPEKAIEVSHSLGALMITLMVIFPPAWALGWALKTLYAGSALSNLLGVGLEYLYKIYLILLLYAVFAVLIRVPAINSLFKYTTFTPLFRRYHEPGTKVSEMNRKTD